MKHATPTELRILKCIADGHSTNQMASALGMSKYTVLSHRRNLLLKFDASNSAELVRKAMDSNGAKTPEDVLSFSISKSEELN
ncbi:MAG TPA: helix-turn-helix transcriptional regulator [Chryseolinea sp.]